jgi:excisionase family DNA binding protein
MDEPLMTVEQVSEWLNLTKNTVYRLVKEEGLPAAKIVHSLRFRKAEVERWLKEKTQKERERND